MIDLRSDTVSRPTRSMRQAMAEAEVGDDVWGDDPTVHRLQDAAAQLLGKESALFVTSGTQSNLCALLSHCQRGDEYVAGDNSHTYRYEAGGGAVLGGIQPQPVPILGDGRLDLDHVASVIKEDDPHFARTRLLCLENTHDGKVLPLSFHDEAAEMARANGLGLHLDGARLWNASVALGTAPAEVTEPFDTVSVCLSKGLGAPLGSILAGSEQLIERAYRWRKMLGGAMRQSGVVAAAGLHALEHHIERLADDHANAEALADGLARLPGVGIDGHATNMVFARFGQDPAGLSAHLEAADIKLRIQDDGGCRMVTHLDVTSDDVETVVKTAARYLA